MRLMLDVVVPARAEPLAILSRCLGSLLWDDSGIDLSVVVVANGPDCAETASAARQVAQHLKAPIKVLEVAEGGKASALNAGERNSRGGSIVYLDADVVLLPGTLAALAGALSTDSPSFAAPRRVVAPSASWVTRAYTRVWESLPSVTADIGAGCYAVNAAGRGRWHAFPDVIADDAYVRSRFAADERVVSGGAMISMPEGGDLVRAVGRWRYGNQQLRRLYGASADLRGGVVRSLTHLGARPHLWADFPTFATITALGRALSVPRQSDWRPSRRRTA